MHGSPSRCWAAQDDQSQLAYLCCAAERAQRNGIQHLRLVHVKGDPRRQAPWYSHSLLSKGCFQRIGTPAASCTQLMHGQEGGGVEPHQWSLIRPPQDSVGATLVAGANCCRNKVTLRWASTLSCSRRDMQQLAELTDHKAAIVLCGERNSVSVLVLKSVCLQRNLRCRHPCIVCPRAAAAPDGSSRASSRAARLEASLPPSPCQLGTAQVEQPHPLCHGCQRSIQHPWCRLPVVLRARPG